MIILAVYADLDVLSIALSTNNKCEHNECFSIKEKTLSAILPQTIEQMLDRIKPDCIAFHKGPGGFTSLRVCAAFLQGIAVGYSCFIYTPCHFTLLKEALQLDNQWIAIDNKASMLPAVFIAQDQIGEILFLDRIDCFSKGILIKKRNRMTEQLITMAKRDRHHWIQPGDLIMNYGPLPNYKTVKEESCVV